MQSSDEEDIAADGDFEFKGQRLCLTTTTDTQLHGSVHKTTGSNQRQKWWCDFFDIAGVKNSHSSRWYNRAELLPFFAIEHPGNSQVTLPPKDKRPASEVEQSCPMRRIRPAHNADPPTAVSFEFHDAQIATQENGIALNGTVTMTKGQDRRQVWWGAFIDPGNGSPHSHKSAWYNRDQLAAFIENFRSLQELGGASDSSNDSNDSDSES
jgi:hypothetical protein